MGITTKYFTNTSDFEEIAETLRTADALPDQIDNNFLKNLGFLNPANELILNFFEDLKFLNEDNTPTYLLRKFRERGTSKKVFASRVLEAYGELFDQDPTIHQKSKEEIIQSFQSCLKDEKSNIIINYMVNTFKVLVDYAGHETIEEVWEKKNSDTSALTEPQETDTKKVTSGDEKSTGESNESQSKSETPQAAGQENVNSKESSNYINDALKNSSVSTPVNGTGDGMKKEAQEAELTKLDLTLPVAPEVDMTGEVKKVDYINKAYIKKAELLYKLGRFEEALPVLDKVYQKFADSNEDELYKTASVALIKKMDVAEKLELNDYLISIYSTIIERLDTEEENEFTAFVDQAYVNITEILLEDDQVDKALEIIEKAIHRFKKTEPKSDFLIKTMYKKAELLEQSGSDLEALEAFDEVLKNFSNNNELKTLSH